jgi:subtilisin family serine protease
VTLVEPHSLYALQQEAAADAPSPTPEKAPQPAPAPAYAAALLRLDAAHRVATGHGVRVAVIDSLIDLAHPEIEGSVAAHFDAVGGPTAQPQMHGTGMAGAIAGHRQIEGAAPGAQILAVRAFDGTGATARATGLDILAGIDWAAAQKAQVINMSFAGPVDPLLAKMLEAAARRRIVLIAAAGNDGPDAAPLYPGADANVIAVSAVDAGSRIYAKANRGPYVALAAPGVDVLVAAPSAAYDLSTGTSVACAEISGVAALLLEKHPDLDGPALRRLLQGSARALDGAGAGVADAEAAVTRAP